MCVCVHKKSVHVGVVNWGVGHASADLGGPVRHGQTTYPQLLFLLLLLHLPTSLPAMCRQARLVAESEGTRFETVGATQRLSRHSYCISNG